MSESDVTMQPEWWYCTAHEMTLAALPLHEALITDQVLF